ncbi:hypothetical protein TVAG_118920 [Trichomonas vaginalis G3]|uniref:Uncharacterized protein n=1 Tax=Trichomonas vaginalis (strain ATCC PRA-98 / G3) TaxID=412133 RepID=A2D740_TRIV3|nr:hypothetical protein TVAGG3_0991540 [Trichomonas vaginalis G3]EAY23557.1 hypothetical protein TVAG_118920 [Trichomonas vaginalis G3]KAI5490055.1 hypothetical protein TVAGG3_0991540 [Trichomonas vaginalis G3]|eukprot:XP_001276805.1 hypothetical protein [Trichomonas vaginalis G3]
MPAETIIYTNLETFVPKLFEKPSLTNDLNKLLSSFFISISAVFKLYTAQSEFVADILSSICKLLETITQFSSKAELEVQTYKELFYVVVGIMDFLLINENQTINTTTQQTYIKTLMDILLVLSLERDQFWNDTKNIWIEWNKNNMFTCVLCQQFERYTFEYLKIHFEDDKNATSWLPGELEFDLNAITRLLDVSKVVKIADFVKNYTTTMNRLNSKVSSLCKSKSNIFSSKFPVSIIAAYFIDKSLDILSRSVSVDLLNELISLISYCGYTKETYPFVERTIQVINSIISKFISSSTNASEKLSFISIYYNPNFVPYMTISNHALNLAHIIIGGFTEYNGVVQIYKFLSIFNCISHIPQFKFSSKSIQTLYQNAKRDKNEVKSVIPALKIIYSNGTDEDAANIFTSILDEITSLDEDLLSSVYTLFSALPYSNNADRTKKFFPQEKLKHFVEEASKSSKVVPPALLLALIEISAYSEHLITGLSKSKDTFEKFPELLYLLTQARIKKLKFEVRWDNSIPSDTFIVNDKLYTVSGGDDNHYTIVVRDAGGVSVLTLDELLTDTGKNPTLVDLPKGTASPAHAMQVLQIDVPQTPEISTEDIPSPEPVKSLTMKPFGPVPRNPGRPPIFDVLRMLDLISNPEVRILPRSNNTIKTLNELDQTPSLPTIDVPIYYINQISKSFGIEANNEVLAKFFNSFTKEDTSLNYTRYLLTTNTVRFAFASKENKPSPFGIVFNNSVLDIKEESMKDLPHKIILSITPLGQSMFKVQLHRNSLSIPMAIDGKIPQIVSIRSMAFIFVYFGHLAISDNYDIYASQVKKRKDIISKINEGMTPIDFLCDIQA